MNKIDWIKNIPAAHLKSYDGMPVTAAVWNQAHNEHIADLRNHQALFHQPGILFGLEVRANDPPNRLVFIASGAAIDQSGQLILVQDTVAYDFSEEEPGEYTLYLAYSERETTNSDENIRMTSAEYILAARATVPKKAAIAIAKIRISSPTAPIENATNPLYPQADQIDLRWRQDATQRSILVRTDIWGLFQENEAIINGWEQFATFMESQEVKLLLQTKIADANTVFSNAELIVLYAVGDFSLTKEQTAQIKQLSENGNALIFEALDEKALRSFEKIRPEFNFSIVNTTDSVYQKPNLFRKAPDGFDMDHFKQYQNMLLVSTLATLWNGFIQKNALSRAEIRTAHEWGQNLITHCLRLIH